MRIGREELQKYVDLKMSQRAIAQKTGIPEPTIAWTMRRYGIESLLKPDPRPSQDKLEDLYCKEGLSIRGVASQLGRSESAVRRWMREYGIKTRPKGTNQSGEPMTARVFSDRAAGFGHRVTGEYSGWNDRVSYVCRCGRDAFSFPVVLLRGGGCKACASERIGKSKRIPDSIVEAEMEKNGDTHISSYYLGGSRRVKYNCSSCGNDADVLWLNYRKGQKCGGCRKLKFTGENNPNWNPDLTDQDRLELGRYEEGYKSWARKVKHRDGYLCQCCKEKSSGKLVSHHLNSYSTHEHSRTDVDNGVTLCETCHKEFHSAYGYGGNTTEQFFQFLKERK